MPSPSPVDRVNEVVEGYVDLVNELVKDWSPYLAKASTQAPDTQAAAQLAARSALLIGLEAVDALAIMTSDYDERFELGGYHTDPAKAGTNRTLTVKGNFTSVTGKILPWERLTLVPNALAPKETAFEIDCDGDGLKARTYDGYVLSTDALGDVEEIFVSVTVG